MVRHSPLFHSILAATASEEAVDAAVLTAARLAACQHARLSIVHAKRLPKPAGRKAWIIPDRPPRSNKIPTEWRVAAQKLHSLYAAHCPALKSEDVRIVWGVAWEAVFRAAGKVNCDLIVMGPHTRTAEMANISKVMRFIGSTTDGVIRHSRCPVLIANRAFNDKELEFANIVVGVDFSDSCTAAVSLAALFAKHWGANVSTFHMLPIPPYPKYPSQALQADHMRQQKRMIALCSKLLEGDGHQFIVKPGVQPHVELLQFVQQVGADLIVMGSHTKDRTGKWYAGSVVQQVACHARCPVIVVNGPDALQPWGWVNLPP
jgi:nucleotide-binding universal stress UspA family protein